jgi:hypothetical protein
MEPDFESTLEALVTRIELRSITSSQVLARPSEWLELLRRYGNVAPFFCLNIRAQQSLHQPQTFVSATSKPACSLNFATQRSKKDEKMHDRSLSPSASKNGATK